MYNTTKIFATLVTAFFLFTSCSKENFGLLFYDWKEYDGNGFFLLNGQYYSIKINYDQILNLPEPVKCYTIKSRIVDNERITENFFNYEGQITATNTSIDFKKRYHIKDHISGLVPRYQAEGRSFPVRISSTMNNYAEVEAKIGFYNILKKMNIDDAAKTDLCVLKYLAQMAWYPTSFVNNNLTWRANLVNGTTDTNSAHLTLRDNSFVASGNMYFDSLTCLPTHFTGTITQAMFNKMLISHFEVSYSNYTNKCSFDVPLKCIATITDEAKSEIVIEMELKEYKPIVYKTLTNKEFMKQQKKMRERAQKRENNKFRAFFRRLFKR